MVALRIWMVLVDNRLLVYSLTMHFLKNLWKSLYKILEKEHILICYYIGFGKRAYSMKMLIINMSIIYFRAITLPKLLTRKYLLNGLPLRIHCSRPSLLRIQK